MAICLYLGCFWIKVRGVQAYPRLLHGITTLYRWPNPGTGVPKNQKSYAKHMFPIKKWVGLFENMYGTSGHDKMFQN